MVIGRISPHPARDRALTVRGRRGVGITEIVAAFGTDSRAQIPEVPLEGGEGPERNTTDLPHSIVYLMWMAAGCSLTRSFVVADGKNLRYSMSLSKRVSNRL